MCRTPTLPGGGGGEEFLKKPQGGGIGKFQDGWGYLKLGGGRFKVGGWHVCGVQNR